MDDAVLVQLKLALIEINEADGLSDELRQTMAHALEEMIQLVTHRSTT